MTDFGSKAIDERQLSALVSLSLGANFVASKVDMPEEAHDHWGVIGRPWREIVVGTWPRTEVAGAVQLKAHVNAGMMNFQLHDVEQPKFC
jgi:hypothetical protein